MKRTLTALLLLPLMAASGVALASPHNRSSSGIYQTGGPQVATPFACITDHGPRVWCDEPVHVYGN